MESVSIPTNPVSSFISVSECMVSWIQCSPLYWYRVYLTSPLLESPLPLARNSYSSPDSLNPCEVWSLALHQVDCFFCPPSIYYSNCCVHFLWFFLPIILSPCPSNPSAYTDWNFNLVLLLLSPWIHWLQPCQAALLNYLSLLLQ